MERSGLTPEHVEAFGVRVIVWVEEGLVGVGAGAAVIFVGIETPTANSLPFLQLLLLDTVKHLFHWIDFLQGFTLTINLRIVVVGGEVLLVDGRGLFGIYHVIIFNLHILLLLVFLQMLFFVVFSFFLVRLSFFVVISGLEPTINFVEDICLESIQIQLRYRWLSWCSINGLRHWQSAGMCKLSCCH